MGIPYHAIRKFLNRHARRHARPPWAKRTFREYVERLEDKFQAHSEHSFPTTPYGGGNPYSYCNDCQRSVPEINGDPKRHMSHCRWAGNFLMVRGLRRKMEAIL